MQAGSLAYRRKPGMQTVLLRSLWIPKAPPPPPPISSPCWEPTWNLFLVLKGILLQGDSVILRAQSLQPLMSWSPSHRLSQAGLVSTQTFHSSQQSPGPGRGEVLPIPGLLTPKLDPSGHQSPPPLRNRPRALSSGLTHILSTTF